MELGDERQSLVCLPRAVYAARACAFAAVSANDHFLFKRCGWKGPMALAAVVELAATVSLVAPRGRVPLTKTLAARDLLPDGRVLPLGGPGHRSAITTQSACPRGALGAVRRATAIP
jgi:hypothetical protein